MAKHCYFKLPNAAPNATFRCNFTTDRNLLHDGKDLAELCAYEYWIRHEGYELEWPQVIAIHATDHTEELSRWTVDMRMEPEFWARKTGE